MPRSSTIDGIATLTMVESTMMRATATLMATSPNHFRRSAAVRSGVPDVLDRVMRGNNQLAA